MPTLSDLQRRAQDWLTGIWPDMVSRQDSYRKEHGRYWQGLPMFETPPDHTLSRNADKVPDALSRKPTDVSEDWSAVFPEFAAGEFPASLSVDCYGGPLGQGFVAILLVQHEGVSYRLARNNGPESFRSEPWSKYDSDKSLDGDSMSIERR